MSNHEIKSIGSSDWIKNHWVQILVYSIAAILLIGILKCLTQLFGGGTIGKGISDVLGAAANLSNGLTNGCSKQPDCSKSTDSKNCPTSGCGWNPPVKSGDKGTCYNNTGNKTGSGGFFSLKCGIGVGFLVYIAGQLLLPIVSLFASRFAVKSENVKTASRLSGKSISETLKEVVDRATEISETAKQDLISKGKELTQSDEVLIEKFAASKADTDRVIEAVKSNQELTPEQRIVVADEARATQAQVNEEISEQAKNDGIEPDMLDETRDAVDNAI